MAIQFARARYVSRSSGGTGEVFYFRHREAPEHHEVLLPEGAAERFCDSGVLWNAAERAEKRRDAQVARELVVALPADAAVTGEDRIDIVRSFAEAHFVGKGLAVQLDVHAPHEGEAAAEHANWHAHLLVTTKRLDGDKFSAKKARDLDPEVRSAKGRAIVADGEAWGELWRDHQNRWFREHGTDLAVDPVAAHPAPHIGPVRMRVAGAEIVERAEEIRRANEAAAHDPEQVLAALTRHNATFTERDLDRFLGKHLADESERQAVKDRVLERDQVGVPKLSPEAMAVLDAVHAAGDRPAVARAWEVGRRNPAVAAELDRFEKAAAQRLGGEGVAALLRDSREGPHFSAPGVERGEERALRELAHGLAAARHGLVEHYRQRAQEEAEHRQEQRQQARHRGLSLGR